MKYGKREYRLPKTENRQETGKAESGQVSWVLGLFLILFLAILLYMQLQLAMYKASARYLEDAFGTVQSKNGVSKRPVETSKRGSV